MHDGSGRLINELEVQRLAAAGELLHEADEVSSGTSLSPLPPPRLQEEVDWLGEPRLPTWPQYAWARAQDWWRQAACYALLALIQAGLPCNELARPIFKLLVPDELVLEDLNLRIAVCPFPDADILEAVWDHLSDAYVGGCYLPDFSTLLGRISGQVLGLPRLAHWVRQGRGSQVVGFLLSSQGDFLTRPLLRRQPPRWPWHHPPPPSGGDDSDCGRNISLRMYERWFATRAPAAIAAHLLLSGELCVKALAGDAGTSPPKQLVHEEVMLTESSREAGEATCREEVDALRRSWQAFREAEAERNERRRTALEARFAAQLEREQRRRLKRLQRAGAASLAKPGRPCEQWSGQRDWRRRQ